MKVNLLLVGKTVNKHFVELIEDYASRVKHYIGFEINIIPELKNTKNLSIDQQKQQEGELILRQLLPSDSVVLLDEHGKELGSVDFSKYLEQKMQTTNKRLVFVVGGPYGFSPDVYNRANDKLSRHIKRSERHPYGQAHQHVAQDAPQAAVGAKGQRAVEQPRQ